MKKDTIDAVSAIASRIFENQMTLNIGKQIVFRLNTTEIKQNIDKLTI